MARKQQFVISKLGRASIPMSLINFVSVAVLLAALEWGLIPQTKQGFYCDDPTISFPFRGDTISLTSLLVVSIFGPLLVIVFVEALRENSFAQIRWMTVWLWYKEYLIVMCLVLLVTEAGKVVFGEHRPHFIATCVPDTSKSCESGSFVDDFKCTNNDVSQYNVIDSSRSFPSGHSSLSVFASIYSCVSATLTVSLKTTNNMISIGTKRRKNKYVAPLERKSNYP